MSRAGLAGLVLSAALTALAQTREPANASRETDKPLSELVVAYTIDAKLDAARKVVDANETLVYRNLTGQALDRFPFHLYLNAFEPQSTFIRERRRDGPGFRWDPKHKGSIEIRSLEVTGQGDLTKELRFVHPDDENRDDRTVVEVVLPHLVPAGGSVEFKIAFRSTFPETLARTGYKRDFIMGAQWFPKLGVFWKGAWNCHQFHASTEFFADFGTYDVRLTLPKDYVVGATGEQVESTDNADGTRTLRFAAADVHDFAWAADPGFHVIEDSWTGSAGPVKLRVLMQPGHGRQAPRYLHALKGTLTLFDKWYGPYPYRTLTLVDPEPGSAAGGMEYPTLFTAGTTWWVPRGLHFPEVVTEHEFGHQYWYGMVATNEFEDAWLDEGLNSYTETKVMEALYGRGRSMIDLGSTRGGGAGFYRLGYIGQADTDPLARASYTYMSGAVAGAVSYAKTVTVLSTLEGLVGEETVRRAISAYFMRYRFTHPTKEDFLRTLEEVSGKDLRWYFDQAVYGTQVLDYAVGDAQSQRVDWFADKPPKEKKGETLYRSQVLVRRKGDFLFPVELEVLFDDGTKTRERWDGRERWMRYTYERKAKLVSAELDPDHKLWLDRDLLNNSRRLAPERTASRKLANLWLVLTQRLALLLAWLA